MNDAIFLRGVEKAAITGILRPHLYFDDQATHLTGTATNVASVHVPFGKINA